MAEPSAIEGCLRAMVEAMEAREAAEPDLPEWEANARLKSAEDELLRLYRASPHEHGQLIAIEMDLASGVSDTVEVA